MQVFGKQAFLDAIGHDLSRLHWHDVREDGVYVRNPTSEDVRLGFTDRVVRHPLGDFDKPALPFPFTLEQFIAFDETVGIAFETPAEVFDRIKASAPLAHELLSTALTATWRRKLRRWLDLELWAFREAAYLLNGHEPEGELDFKVNVIHGPDDQPVALTYRGIKDAALAKSLPFIEADGLFMRRRVRPVDALEWGRRRGMPVPTALTAPTASTEVVTKEPAQAKHQAASTFVSPVEAPGRTLATPELADAFDGIDEVTAAQWRSRLGDLRKHKWMRPARATKGRAPNPATWWPLKFAELLHERGTSYESLNRAFLNVAALKPWLPEWQAARRERNAFGQ